MANILTNEQVKTALFLDYDYDVTELTRLAVLASSYLKQKTGFDWTLEATLNPLAIQAATLYVKQQFFGSDGYNKEHDYSLGLASLIVDLQVIANSKIAAAEVDALIDLIPSVEEITLADAETIETAREAYDELYEIDIEYVTKYDTLVAAEEKLATL